MFSDRILIWSPGVFNLLCGSSKKQEWEYGDWFKLAPVEGNLRAVVNAEIDPWVL
jgi:hypothetical protein